MNVAAPPKEPLVVNFKQESVTTVSRQAVRVMSKKLGLTETGVVHYALAQLRNEVLDEDERDELAPLTVAQHQRIAQAGPKKRGKVIASLLP
jgi:hypothetical protein